MFGFPTWDILSRVELTAPPKQTQTMLALMLPGNNSAHYWGIEVYQNWEAVNWLSEGTVSAYCLRPDGTTVVIPGDSMDNIAYVSFPSQFYAISGIIKCEIRWTHSAGRSVTLDYKNFVVLPTCDSGTYVDPGSVIPTISDLLAQLDAMATATAAAESAANHSVVYDQYEQLTETQKVTARSNIGMDFIDGLNTWTAQQRYSAKQNLNIPVIEPIYDPTHSYAVGDTCTYLECCYVCHTATTGTAQNPVPFSWDTNWTYISLRAQTLWITEQYLTEAQKNQTRVNIDAAVAGITPERYGAKGDGVTDDTNALLEAFSAAWNSGVPLVFAPGRVYTTTRELQIYRRMTIFGNGATIKAIGSVGNVIYIENDTHAQFPAYLGKGLITNLTIDCNFLANCGIFTTRSQGERFQDIDVCHFLKWGIRAQDGFEVFMENVRVAGRDVGDTSAHGVTDPTVGVCAYCSDSHFTNVVTINVDIGVLNHGHANSFTHLHSWNTAADIVPTSVMIETHFPTMLENSYIDTCAVGVKVDDDEVSNIGVHVNGLFVLHGGSGSGGYMPPSVMGNIVPCVFSVPDVASAAYVKGYGIEYLSPTETYNLFDQSVQSSAFNWPVNNDASITNMGNVPTT